MSRQTLDIYLGLIRTRVDPQVSAKAESLFDRYSKVFINGAPLSQHLHRFLTLFAKLLAVLDDRRRVDITDLTVSVDLLDIFTSTTKWWDITRKDPAIVIRPSSHDPRQFLLTVGSIQLSGSTLSRIAGSLDRLRRFLDDQELSPSDDYTDLIESFSSIWVLLTLFICKNQGRTVTTEDDFEHAYDLVRVLLFYTPQEDFRALTAVRHICSSSAIHGAADVVLTTEFEHLLESSPAASLEHEHGESLAKILPANPHIMRSILTNVIRVLVRLVAFMEQQTRVEGSLYEHMITRALDILESIGVSRSLFTTNSSVSKLFESIRPLSQCEQRISLLCRRFESLIVASIGNKEFLLQYPKFVPQLVSLIVLVAAATRPLDQVLGYHDIKRGLILFDQLLVSLV